MWYDALDRDDSQMSQMSEWRVGVVKNKTEATPGESQGEGGIIAVEQVIAGGSHKPWTGPVGSRQESTAARENQRYRDEESPFTPMDLGWNCSIMDGSFDESSSGGEEGIEEERQPTEVVEQRGGTSRNATTKKKNDSNRKWDAAPN